MKYFRIVALFILLLAMPVASFGAVTAKTGTFLGAWFSVQYPSNFKLIPSMESVSLQNHYDSAKFVSPDKKVEFYIYSPQWLGGDIPEKLQDSDHEVEVFNYIPVWQAAEPNDVKINTKQEKLVSKTKQKSGTKTITRWTIKEKSGKYFRSYEDITDSKTNTRTVFGMKYQNMAAYNKYLAQYKNFKKSLEQFAD